MFDLLKKQNPETTGLMVLVAMFRGMVYGAMVFGLQAYMLRQSTPYWLLALPIFLVIGGIVGGWMEWRHP